MLHFDGIPAIAEHATHALRREIAGIEEWARRDEAEMVRLREEIDRLTERLEEGAKRKDVLVAALGKLAV